MTAPTQAEILAAADTLERLNAAFEFGPRFPWDPESLRDEAPIVGGAS